MNKYEQLIEAIIGDNQALAKSLFHSIVVEKSRSIYESLLDAEDGAHMSTSQDKSFGLDDDESDEMSMKEGAMSGIDQVMQDIASGERDIYELLASPKGADEEAAVDHLRERYDQLAGERNLHADDDFEEIIGLLQDEINSEHGEAVTEGDSIDGEEDLDSMDDIDGVASEVEDSDAGSADVEDRVMDLETALDELRAEFDELMAHEEAEEEGEESEEEGEESGEEVGDEIPAAHKDQSNPVDVMREYVEKVTAPSNADQATNKTSVVAKKNDMGGTTANIARGGAAETGGKVKSPQEIDVAKRNVNKPGGNGADKFFSGKVKAAGLSESAVKSKAKITKK